MTSKSKNLKVLQIVADGNPGGGTTLVLEVLKSLEKPIFISQTNSYATSIASSLGIETYELDFFTSRLDLRISIKMRTLINHVKPDLIHVHGNRAAFFLSFFRCPCPVIYTVHGLHGLYNGNFFGKWGEKQAIRSADHVVFVSKWEQSLAQRNKLITSQAHQVIYNGLKIPKFKKRISRRDFISLKIFEFKNA